MQVNNSFINVGYNTTGKQRVFETKIQGLRNNLGKKGAKFPITQITDAYNVIMNQKSKNIFHTGKHTKIALKAITQEVLNIVDRNDSTLTLNVKKKILSTLNVLKDDYPNAFDSGLIGELNLKIEENKTSLMDEQRAKDAEMARVKEIDDLKLEREIAELRARLDKL